MAAHGTVLSIERFAMHDGPGIRSLVLFKGCPLRCQWCSTPNSQNAFPEMIYTAGRCITCGKCIEACDRRAISSSDEGAIVTNIRLCDNCGECAAVCPTGARKMSGISMTSEMVMEEVMKDSVFYWNSGGGVTLGGGEPTMQPKFCIEILRASKNEGIHTAIETNGYSRWDILGKIIELVDLMHVDVKHMSSAEHKRLTGKGNRLILDNISKVARQYVDISLVVRVPIIPSCNDSEENMSATAAFVAGLERVQRVELLPYHKLGSWRYAALQRRYALECLEPPSQRRMDELKGLFESYGIDTRIGG